MIGGVPVKKKLTKALIYLALLVVIVFGSRIFRLADFHEIGHMFEGFDAFRLVKLLVMCLFVLLVAELIKMLLGAFTGKRHRSQTLYSILVSLTRYAAAIVILCWGLSIIGVDVSTILASVGLVALIIGFGAESLIADVITGIFMLFENQYNVGDIIEVKGFRGTVSSIGIRTTSITDTSGNIKILNNSEMSDILNRSNNSSKAICDFAIPYSTDLEALEAKLAEMLKGIHERNSTVLIDTPEYCGVQQLADSAVILRFVAEVPEKSIYVGARVLNRELLLQMRKAGIECPFPQIGINQQ